MRIGKLVYFGLLLFYASSLWSQSNVLFEDSFTEETTIQDKFAIYLDSTDKYLYRDIDLANLALAECQKIIDQNVYLSDSLKFEYVLQKIYFEFSLADPLGAYQIILDNDKIASGEGITELQKSSYNYLKGFTYMSIGDLEAAQKLYYQQLETGKANNDSTTILKSAYSLGQLFNDEQEYEEAIKSFNQVLEYHDLILERRPSTLVLTYIELSETYAFLKDYKKALELLEKSWSLCEEYDIGVLKSDVLMMKGNIYLSMEDIAATEEVYQKLVERNISSNDQNNLKNTQKMLASIHRAKKKYPEALSIYQEIIETTDSSGLDDIIETYENMHEVYMAAGNYDEAYKHLLSYNEFKHKRDEDAKRQKTSYLKIKYDSEQKEKENLKLAAEVAHNKAEQKLLYGWTALSALGLIILIGAFYQKGRYSKKLEAEVLRRTDKLRKSNELLNQSNEELDEFNRILSHDLKEPLRSIVSFSQLADRNIIDTEKAREYLKYVIKSGNQLEQLIQGVNVFRKTNSKEDKDTSEVNIPALLNGIVADLKNEYEDKEINFSCDTNVSIVAAENLLRPVFKNILDNAVKFNEHKDVVIKVSYHQRNQMHTFEIEDNGVGISEQYHKKVFELFKRLHSRKTYTGVGLGLSIAQRLVENIGGEISILRSYVNKGSTFMLRLPLSTALNKEGALEKQESEPYI